MPGDVLTLNIAPQSERAAVSVLSRSTELLNDLYEATALAYHKKAEGLLIVKVESGSSIRLDCKGLGDVVKHLKDFILEAWHKVRHKRPEEVIENNKALLSSLAIIDHINSCVSHHGLSPEEGEALRRRVVKDALGLFECGALIAEIPAAENVNNTRLLGGFSPKLLPESTGSKAKPTKKKVTRKKQAKKAPTKRPRKKS